MAALIKSVKIFTQLNSRNPAVVQQLIRHHWNKDYKPAPYPKTKEELDRAAKKYNLLPEEYVPYKDDGLGYGDYPKLPNVGTESRDPYYPYDYPELRRNFNEPIHVDVDLYSEDRYSWAEPPRFSLATQVYAFLGVMTGCFVLFFFLEDYKLFRPVKPKQLPANLTDGKAHYTFETAKQ